MDDKLRAKLEEILNDFGNEVLGDASWVRLGGDSTADGNKVFAQIDQAYHEAGALLPREDGVYHLKAGIELNFRTDVMTGGEWYARFKDEATKLHPIDEMKLGNVLEAAKKAAGIE